MSIIFQLINYPALGILATFSKIIRLLTSKIFLKVVAMKNGNIDCFLLAY
jgi:hypothetical protein